MQQVNTHVCQLAYTRLLAGRNKGVGKFFASIFQRILRSFIFYDKEAVLVSPLDPQICIKIPRYGTVEFFCERKVITVIIVISVAGCSVAGQAKQKSFHI